MTTKKGNLLIIDDEVILLEKTAILLEDIADEIFTADNGQLGLEILSSNEINCIICDINMPNMNGVEVLKSIREKELQTPFIFYTGHGSRELMKEAIKLGAFDFIDKPNLEGLEEIASRGLSQGITSSNGNTEDDNANFISEYKKLLSQG